MLKLQKLNQISLTLENDDQVGRKIFIAHDLYFSVKVFNPACKTFI